MILEGIPWKYEMQITFFESIVNSYGTLKTNIIVTKNLIKCLLDICNILKS